MCRKKLRLRTPIFGVRGNHDLFSLAEYQAVARSTAEGFLSDASEELAVPPGGVLVSQRAVLARSNAIGIFFLASAAPGQNMGSCGVDDLYA